MAKIKMYIVSLGCPKNRVDTEKMLGTLDHAWRTEKDPRKADVVLINTCAFIAPAVEESIQEILGIAEEVKTLKNRPWIVVTGCLVARYGQNKLCSLLPEADCFLEISRQKDFPEMVAQKIDLPAGAKPFQFLTTGPGYGFVKLSEGCNNKCSFCTIPALRGRLKSRQMDAILRDARNLLRQGASELVLVAQNSTAYGQDMLEKKSLIRVLDNLLHLDGLQRLRLMYMYPSGLTGELLKFIRDAGPKMLPYFDIPLQHAHTDILRRMGRPFAKDPQIVVDMIRDKLPQAALRTTMIVGFPGEKAQHFDRLISFVARNRFNNLGAFPYYPEDGTRAATMPDQVAEEEKQKRLDELMQLQRSISTEILRKYEDREIEVLVDSEHMEWPGLHIGRAWFQAPEVDGLTYISGPDVAPGRICTALVQESKDYDLVAMT